MLKKVTLIVLALLLTLSFAACGRNDNTTENTTTEMSYDKQFTATITKIDAMVTGSHKMFVVGVISEEFSGAVSITAEQYACLNIGDTVTVCITGHKLSEKFAYIKEYNSKNMRFEFIY